MAETFRVTLPNTETKHALPGSKIIASGTIALDGSNPTTVNCATTHGINTVKAATVNLNTATALADLVEEVTVTWSGSSLNFYAWTNTSGTDPTLVASTSTLTVSYDVVGIV